MRIVEMQPKKKSTVRHLASPPECMIDHISRPPLNRLVAIHSAPAQMKSGVIHVKSAIKTWSRAVQRIENQRPDKSSRMIPMLMQDVRQIGKPGRERNAKIVDVIELRVRSREYGRVRCRCQRHMRVGTS